MADVGWRGTLAALAAAEAIRVDVQDARRWRLWFVPRLQASAHSMSMPMSHVPCANSRPNSWGICPGSCVASVRSAPFALTKQGRDRGWRRLFESAAWEAEWILYTVHCVRDGPMGDADGHSRFVYSEKKLSLRCDHLRPVNTKLILIECRTCRLPTCQVATHP